MKFHKIISRTIAATALLGATFGGALSSINVSADNVNVGANSTHSTNASEYIEHNGLTLDSVPTFNFNKQISDSNNQITLNQDGQLRVSDYRASDDSTTDNGNPKGWSLDVSADSVNQSQDENNDWTLSLNQSSLDNMNDSSIPKASTSGINQTNLHTNSTSGSGDHQLISNGRYGLTSLTYHNNSDNAVLSIPNVHPGSYNMNVNWTLRPNMNSKTEN